MEEMKFQGLAAEIMAKGLKLLETLYPGGQGFVEVRTLPNGRSKFFPVGDWSDLPPYAARAALSGQGVYFGVALRDGQGGSLEHCTEWPGAWADLDYKDFEDPADAQAALDAFQLKPTAVVESGGGLHAYWTFSEPTADHTAVVDINKRLAAALGGDSKATDGARILRLPGTVNTKYDPPRPVELAYLNGARYAPEDFHFLPPLETKTRQEQRKKSTGTSTTPYGKAALEGETGKVALAPDGERNHVLNTAAVKLGHLVAGGEIDRAEAEAELLRAALVAGLPEAEARKTIRSGLEAGMKEPKSAPTGSDKNPSYPSSAPEDDETCAPISLDTPPAPPIPVELFPKWCGEFAVAVAHAIQVPVELALNDIIGVLAIACQKKAAVYVEGIHWETLNFWTLCPLPSGERKSATLNVCKEVVVEYELEMIAEAKPAIEKARSRQKAIEALIKQRNTDLAKASLNSERERIMEDLEQLQQSLPEIPAEPRLLEDDVTPEALCVTLDDNDEKVGFLAAEGGLFEVLGGRYSSGRPNLDLFCKGYTGEGHRHTRSNGRPAIILQRPLISMAMSPQPHILAAIMRNPAFRNQGFLARFVYFCPQSRVGFRENGTSRTIPQRVQDRYNDLVRALFELQEDRDIAGNPRPWTLRFSPEALSLFQAFQGAVEIEMRPHGELHHLKDWGARLPGFAARLAGIFHLAECVAGEVHPTEWGIPADIMGNAIRLATLAKDHALVAFDQIGADENREAARRILKWLQEKRPATFRPREALNACKGSASTANMDKIYMGLGVLHDHGYIFPLEPVPQRGKRGRRPGAPYRVNPNTYGGGNGAQ